MASSAISGSLAVQAQSAFLESKQKHLLAQMQSDQGSSKDDKKIEKSATEFESMLLGSWLQQAEQSMATVPGAEDDEDAAGREQMMSLGVQSLAGGLAASGGIGIGKMIAQALHHAADKGQAAAEPATPAKTAETTK